ncbi:MAG: hypothetical protein IJD41_02160 [Alphaproteobacteria bacterium]|nr:hypothetical protein [Alphaproteobacteria bacterium]MBQ7127740.1 hypothetical protein [Alphaproteobacteria bacterium]
MTKRLFLFAGYDKHGVIDDALIMYVRALNKLGDVVVCMDSDCTKDELQKLQGITLYAMATRHGEYDFGSYKRAYNWARENLDISSYDFVYMANDSMYGPLFDLAPYLEKLESENLDAFGMVKNPHRKSPHIQSWFIGMRKSVFMSEWFNDLLQSVRHHDDKGSVTILYEHGFTKRLIENNLSWDAPYAAPGRSIYNRVKYFYKRKMPFIKKLAFSRHGGALGRQLLYILNHVSPDISSAIMQNANRVYGNEYISKILTHNPFKIMWRNIKYTIYKLRTDGI